MSWFIATIVTNKVPVTFIFLLCDIKMWFSYYGILKCDFSGLNQTISFVWSPDTKPYCLSYSLIMLCLLTTVKAWWPLAAMCHIIIDIEDIDKYYLDIKWGLLAIHILKSNYDEKVEPQKWFLLQQNDKRSPSGGPKSIWIQM